MDPAAGGIPCAPRVDLVGSGLSGGTEEVSRLGPAPFEHLRPAFPVGRRRLGQGILEDPADELAQVQRVEGRGLLRPLADLGLTARPIRAR